MIAFAAILLLSSSIADERILEIRLDQAGEQCSMTLGGVSVDPRDDDAVKKAFVPYNPDTTLIEISGGENITYRCIGGVIYRIQARGFRFAKQGFVMGPPPTPRPAR